MAKPTQAVLDMLSYLAEKFPDGDHSKVISAVKSAKTEETALEAISNHILKLSGGFDYVDPEPPIEYADNLSGLMERSREMTKNDVTSIRGKNSGFSVSEGTIFGSAEQKRHGFHTTLEGKEVNTKSKAFAKDMAERVRRGELTAKQALSGKSERVQNWITAELRVNPKASLPALTGSVNESKAIVKMGGLGELVGEPTATGPSQGVGASMRSLRGQKLLTDTMSPFAQPPVGKISPENLAQHIDEYSLKAWPYGGSENVGKAASGVAMGEEAYAVKAAAKEGSWLAKLLGGGKGAMGVLGKVAGPAFGVLTAIQLAQLLEGSTAGLTNKQRLEQFGDQYSGSQKLLDGALLSDEENLNKMLKAAGGRNRVLESIATRDAITNQNTLDNLIETQRDVVGHMATQYQPGPMEMVAAMRQLTGI